MLFNATDEFGNRGMDVKTMREYNEQKESKLSTKRIDSNTAEGIVSVEPNGSINSDTDMNIDIDAPNNLDARDK